MNIQVEGYQMSEDDVAKLNAADIWIRDTHAIDIISVDVRKVKDGVVIVADVLVDNDSMTLTFGATSIEQAVSIITDEVSLYLTERESINNRVVVH